MIKKIGRIVMLAVAVAFIVYAAFRIKGTITDYSFSFAEIIEQVKAGNWEFFSKFIDLGWGILYGLVGLSALLVAWKGHAGFWTFIASGLMLGFFIFGLVTSIKGGHDWKDYILNLSLDVICQLAYAGGILLVMYGNHREKGEIKKLRRYKREHQDY